MSIYDVLFVIIVTKMDLLPVGISLRLQITFLTTRNERVCDFKQFRHLNIWGNTKALDARLMWKLSYS